jgi:hypothetical protein
MAALVNCVEEPRVQRLEPCGEASETLERWQAVRFGHQVKRLGVGVRDLERFEVVAGHDLCPITELNFPLRYVAGLNRGASALVRTSKTAVAALYDVIGAVAETRTSDQVECGAHVCSKRHSWSMLTVPRVA